MHILFNVLFCTHFFCYHLTIKTFFTCWTFPFSRQHYVRDLSEISKGGGLGIWNLGSEMRWPIPAMGVKFANPPLERSLKYPPFNGPFFMTPPFSESQKVVTLPLFPPPSPLLISDKSLANKAYCCCCCYSRGADTVTPNKKCYANVSACITSAYILMQTDPRVS